MDEESDAPPADAGAPKWMTTFADLSTLLLCFFVLLLSFSEMDIAKFKQLAGSMRQAFGVQAEIKVKDIPKGTSIIAREFSPAEPKPTALNQVRQFTIDSVKNTLKFVDPKELERLKKLVERQEKAKAEAERISKALSKEIAEGKVLVRSVGTQTVIHILERGSFRLGSADMNPDFAPILDTINGLLVGTTGRIRVAGHTDNLPIRTSRFRSNWELSSARAVTVLQALLQGKNLDADRFVAAGHADTRPLEPNDSSAGRERNRRVDIAIIQGDDDTLSAESLESLDPLALSDATPTPGAAAVAAATAAPSATNTSESVRAE